jgi:hypothetical protein
MTSGLRKFIVLGLIGLGISAQANEIAVTSPLSSTLIEAWSRQLTHPVECREISDIPGTIFCFAKTKQKLSKMMGRVSYFVESNSKGTITDPSSSKYTRSAAANYEGHDIQGEDYDGFHQELEEVCLKNSKLCANSMEKELKVDVIDPFKARGFDNYVVISTWVRTPRLSQVVSHEILHARFFLNLEYRLAVEDFWMNEVEPKDKRTIYNLLARTYDLTGMNGNTLLLNEFQAYTLQKGSRTTDLGVDSSKYQKKLRDRLSIFLEHR